MHMSADRAVTSEHDNLKILSKVSKISRHGNILIGCAGDADVCVKVHNILFDPPPKPTYKYLLKDFTTKVVEVTGEDHEVQIL